MEAQKFVWEGAIPLQIHLHESEVTTLPPPPPALILAPRVGYLPLLAPLIKPHFASALPPGVDTVWFEYKGLPLKWFETPLTILLQQFATIPMSLFLFCFGLMAVVDAFALLSGTYPPGFFSISSVLNLKDLGT